MTIETQYEIEISDMKARVEELVVARKPIDDEIADLTERIDATTDALNKHKVEQMGDVIDWSFLLSTDKRGSREKSNALDKALSEYDLINSISYNPLTMQKRIIVSLPWKASEDKIDLVQDGIETILPHMIPFHSDDFDSDVVFFDVLDDDLSYTEVLQLVYNCNTSIWHFADTSYGHIREKTRGNLRDVLKYVSEKHGRS